MSHEQRMDYWMQEANQLRECVEAAEAERDRLREALQLVHDTNLLACRDYVLKAFTDEANKRAEHPDDWVERERITCSIAANLWAEVHGIDERVTFDDVEKLEQRAVGHSDYATKLALYVAESIVFSGVSEGKNK